jgi:hypothetical protein
MIADSARALRRGRLFGGFDGFCGEGVTAKLAVDDNFVAGEHLMSGAKGDNAQPRIWFQAPEISNRR